MASDIRVNINSNTPLISVVMPVFNGAQFISQAILSILQQDYPNLELIVVDDGSTDDSIKQVEGFDDPRITLLRHGTNMGISAARNTGLENCAGKYVAILDCDDIAMPERLQRQVDFLECHPDHSICAGLAKIIDSEGIPTGQVWGEPELSAFIPAVLLFRNCIVQSSVCIRRSAIPPEGYRNLAPSEDYDLWVRMCRNSKAAILPHEVVQYRLYSESTSRTHAQKARTSRRQVVQTQLSELGLLPSEDQIAFHLRLSNYRHRLEEDEWDPAYEWMKSLVTANEQNKIFHPSLLAIVIQSLWLHLIAARSDGPWVSIPMLRNYTGYRWQLERTHIKFQGRMAVAQEGTALSVIVCTFNRSDLLEGVLRSLEAQTLDKSLYEVLIVNNNSTDSTESVAKAFCNLNPNFRLVVERQQGLSHARNRGVSEARGSYVAFLDDDARADSTWCERILGSFFNVVPEPFAVGGKIEPWYKATSRKPRWWSESFEIREWGERPRFRREESDRFGFSGSNMAIPRTLLEEIGGFDAGYGMSGAVLGLGEEADLFARIWRKYPGSFWYDPEVLVRHFVPERNMTVSYQLRRMFISGRTGARLHNDPPSARAHVRQFWKLLTSVVSAPFIAATCEENSYYPALIGELRSAAYKAGWIHERTRPVVAHTIYRLRNSLDVFYSSLARRFRASKETSIYRKVPPQFSASFHIVTCGRNTGEHIAKCLDSVYEQNYDRTKITHYVIDDASDDDTCKIAAKWLDAHSGHSVIFHRNTTSKGGTANTQDGFRAAGEHAIVIELNADDWLADENVLGFLSKVYGNPDVWMTYNSFMYSNGASSERRRPYPKRVVRKSTYRDYEWICQHLHSFRASLLKHLPSEVFIDPVTGQFLSKADDRSIYWSLLELCGPHAIHLERIMYVYNFHDQTDYKLDPVGSHENVSKIRKMERFKRLESLD